MKKIREILRLGEHGQSERSIASALGVSRPTVSEYLRRFKQAGLTFAALTAMKDEEMHGMLSKPAAPDAKESRLEARFPDYLRELKRTGVTLKLLWDEYIVEDPDGYRYSQFCHLFYEWRKATSVSMHIEHRAGDKMFVDFAGNKFTYTDQMTGETRRLEVFVAILGASQLTYAEALPDQKLESWIRANENALRYFGGVSRAIVPDNLKAAVTKADRYEPDINPQYADFARHYDTAILPARPRKPKDKALVENAVRLVYERVYAPLRDRTFASSSGVNRAFRALIDEHNNRPMQKLNISRRALFEETERTALRPLPITRYEFRSFQGPTTIQFNYHVYLKADKHYYSVPYRLRKKSRKISLYYTNSAVELYAGSERIAVHARDRRPHGYTTLPEHMPSHHRHVADWSPERILKHAESHGPHVRKLAQSILSGRAHPEQAFKSCQGIVHLAKKYGDFRVNRACKRTLEAGIHSYRTVKNILESGLDQIDEEQPDLRVLPTHENIRGGDYYEEERLNEQRTND